MKTVLTQQDRTRVEYGVAMLTFIGTSLANLLLKRWIGYEAIALVYLLAVVFLALFVGRGPILLGTALTALGWCFLFAPPLYSFRIGSPYDKMMFVTYFVVALTVAQLTARLREERLAERKREAHSRALYLFTGQLVDADDQRDILLRVNAHLSQTFKAEAAIVLASAAAMEGEIKTSVKFSPVEREQIARALKTGAAIGLEPTTTAQRQGIYLPLVARERPMGVLVLRRDHAEPLDTDQLELLENLAKQTVMVLDRQRLRDAEIQSRLTAESDRLGRTLLNSVSHELRTPLAAIATAVDSLRGTGSLTPAQANLSAEIHAALFRLNRVVQSLLSAARIQSGQVRPKMDWCDLADVVRAVLLELEPVLKTHRVERDIPAGLPLVRGDFVLLQQAISNLLVNAAIHTPKGTTIQISAEVSSSEAVLRIADNGPGLPADQLDRIFELFHRLPGAKPGGTGLGLAIVKGFVEAQGGRVQAANRTGHGAEFSIFMPVHEMAQLAEENT